MSRSSQDIPIRPRYGIMEANEESDGFEQRPKQRRALSNVGSSGTSQNRTEVEMASSYSEIPFLAQYAGAVPRNPLGDVTPTEETSGAHGVGKITKSENMNYRSKSESDYDDDDDDNNEDDIENDDENNSKDSSTDAESRKKHKRPVSLQYDSSFPYELERTTSNDGEMRHFIAENLEDQLRTMSPHSRRDQTSFESHNRTPSASTSGSMLTRHFIQTQQPQIDANALSDIELEAQYLAASVDNLMENLCNLLHSISSITADNVEVHRNAVNKLTDSMDANIKCMYTIMAKTEEITKSMRPTEQLGQRIREIKRLVDMLETTM